MPIALSGSLVLSGSITVSGSISSTGGITISGSIASASYAATSSYANTFTVANTLTAQTLVVQTITSSVSYLTGSTQHGQNTGNTHQFTGSVLISGSQTVNGTATFSNKLITGLAASDTTGVYALALNGDYAGLRLGTDTSFNVDVYKSGTGFINPFKIYSSGDSFFRYNVGIGTGTPTTTLSLAGGTTTTFGLSLEPSGWNSAKHRLTVPTSGDTSVWSFNYNGSAVDSALYSPTSISIGQGLITFNTAGSGVAPTERMRISGGGNISIGTTTDVGYKLDVNGSLRVASSLNTTGGTRSISMQSYAADWNYMRSNGSPLVFGTQDAYNLYIRTSDVDRLVISSTGAATFSNTVRVEGSYLQVANASSPSVYINNTSVQWRTYLPSGSNNFAISDAVRDVLTLGYNGGNSYFNGCNVGIGTTGPGKRLEVSEDNASTTSTTGLKITNWSATTDSRAGIVFQNYDNNGAAIWGRRTGSTQGHLVFGTNPGAGNTAESVIAERMRIDNNGYVGINTQTPTATLDINGSVRHRGAIYSDYSFVASGNYSAGTYYDILTANQIPEGIYVIQGYVDTYAVGGGIYFMQFTTVPFYWWNPGCNSTTYTDLPEPIGTGHHKGNALPLFRLQHLLGTQGGYVKLQFNPNANWSGISNGGGSLFNVYLKRLGN